MVSRWRAKIEVSQRVGVKKQWFEGERGKRAMEIPRVSSERSEIEILRERSAKPGILKWLLKKQKREEEERWNLFENHGENEKLRNTRGNSSPRQADQIGKNNNFLRRRAIITKCF